MASLKLEVENATKEGKKGAVKSAEKELKKLEREKQKLQKDKSAAAKYVKVKRDTRLNNRVIDLRVCIPSLPTIILKMQLDSSKPGHIPFAVCSVPAL